MSANTLLLISTFLITLVNAKGGGGRGGGGGGSYGSGEGSGESLNIGVILGIVFGLSKFLQCLIHLQDLTNIFNSCSTGGEFTDTPLCQI